jgi:hypothetical protein
LTILARVHSLNSTNKVATAVKPIFHPRISRS